MHSLVIALLIAAAVLAGAQDLTLEEKPIAGSTELIPGAVSIAMTTVGDPPDPTAFPSLVTEMDTFQATPTNPIGLESPSVTPLGLPASSALSALATPSLEPKPTALSTTPTYPPKTSLASTTAAPSPVSTPSSSSSSSPSPSPSPAPDAPKGKPLTAGAIAGISLGTLIGFGVTVFVVFICVDSGRGVRARKQVLKEEWEGEDMGHGLPEFVGSEGVTNWDVEDEKRHYGVVARAVVKMIGIGRR